MKDIQDIANLVVFGIICYFIYTEHGWALALAIFFIQITILHNNKLLLNITDIVFKIRYPS